MISNFHVAHLEFTAVSESALNDKNAEPATSVASSAFTWRKHGMLTRQFHGSIQDILVQAVRDFLCPFQRDAAEKVESQRSVV